MTVVKSKRSTPKCEAVLKAKTLCEHTLNITKNKNLFTIDSLTNDINHQAEAVYINAYNANNVYVNSHESYMERIVYQQRAIIASKALLALIDMAWHMMHLKGKKVDYWNSLVLSARGTISAWHRADKERYKEYK